MTRRSGLVAQVARQRLVSARRFAIAMRASAEGDGFAEAATRAGLSPAGLATLLYRRLGSTLWPLAAEHRT